MFQADYEKRVLCYAFDIIICYAFALFVTIYWNTFMKLNFSFFVDSMWFFTFFIYFIYNFVCSYFFLGTTIGGVIFNVRIITNNWTKLSVRTSLIRSGMLALFPVVLLNVPYMLIKRTQKSLVDIATETRAIIRK